MAKTRPAVIVSHDTLNSRVRTVMVCAVTSSLHPEWRTRVPITCDGRPAEIAVDHIRTVNKSRLVGRIGRLSESEAAAVRRVLRELYCD